MDRVPSPPSPDVPVFEVDTVSKRLGATLANDRIDLTVADGEFFGLLGNNGAGKTTLVKMLLGLLKPTEGRVRFRGVDVADRKARVVENVGYMPQSAFALNSLTVAEALFYTARIKGLRRAAARADRDRIIDLLGMDAFVGRSAQRLSGGQRRLLQLGVAMTADPPVLVLDEPTNEMDPIRRRAVWELLWRLNRDEGRTIVMVTHNPAEAERVLSKVAIFDAGTVVRGGSPAQLRAGAGDRLRVRVGLDDLPLAAEDLLEVLRQWSAEVSVGYDAVLAHTEPEAVAAIVRVLDGHGIRDYSITPLGLEEIYLSTLAERVAR